MFFFPKDPTFIGVDALASSFKTAKVSKTKKGWKILELKERPMDEKQVLSENKEDILVSCLSSKDVLIRNLEIPLKKEKDIFAALEFQLEPELSFPLESAIVEGQINEKKEASSA